MVTPGTDDGWKTAELRAAEAGLHAAAERGRQAVLRAQQFKAQITPSRVTDGDIGQLEQAAHAHDAPRELRELAERVDRGELSWREIVDGEVMDDPGVRAAFEVNLDRLAQVYRKFEEGFSLEDVMESEGAGRGGRDDDADGGTVLRDRSW